MAHTTLEAKWTAATRRAYFAEHPENFADPDNQAYPIKDADDVEDAWNLAGHADHPDAVRVRVKAIAKRLHLTHALPDTAKEHATSESVASSTQSRSPRARIATLQVCWIEDNARSLNGRIYPAETVDRLIASGQRKLSDTSALPVTCFLSHADADHDNTPALIGKAVRIWREGTRGMAHIDLADTQSARDALALIVGGYLRTESLRASNAELKMDKRYDVPVVGGDAIELDGIDLTNYPGLEACARIQQVQLAESTQQAPLTEVFDLPSSSVAIREVFHKDERMKKTAEASPGASDVHESAGGNMPAYTPASGNSQGMTNDPTQDGYGQRMYQAPEMTSGPMQGMDAALTSSAIDVREAHDRIAMVQNRECAPARESATWKRLLSTLTEQERTVVEAGKALSARNDAHLDAAHHSLAKHLKMECEGVNNKRSAIDPDGDGDDDRTNDPVKNPDWAQDAKNNMESQKKGTGPMSKEEALKLLEAQGYEVNLSRKKSEIELLREQLEAQQAAYAKQMEEMRALISTSQQQTAPAQQDTTPQRRSVASGGGVDTRSIKNQLYHHGKYLKEQINRADWEQLADRTCPLPDGINIENLIKEFEQLYAVQYDDRFQVLSATELR